MADSDKNILITPQIGSASDPTIQFKSGATSGDPITLSVTDDGTISTLSFEGSAGQLFSISNDLTGTIFSVNDVSGIPSIEVDDDGTIRLAEFSGNVLIGTSVDDGNKLQVVGSISTSTDGTSTNWKQAYDNYITGISVTGTTTKTITLTQRDGGTITANFTDIDTDTNTTYTAGTGLTLNGTTFDANVSGTTQTVGANAVSSTASRTYAVQVDASDNLVVNVPWSDTDTNTNTTYTLTAAQTGGTPNDNNPAISLNGSDSSTDTIQLVAGGATTITRVNNGEINISSTDTTAFADLTQKGSGVGNYSTDGDIESGRGSGGVALTINDGKGNANVTFNHNGGVPEQNGNAARIEVNTDSTSGAYMAFEIKSNVTASTSVDLTSVMTLTESAITAESGVTFTGNGSALTNLDYGNISNPPTLPGAPNDATITLSAGTGLADGGNFTTNQASNETITFNLATDRRHNANADVYTGNTSDYIFFDASDGLRFYADTSEKVQIKSAGTTFIGDIYSNGLDPTLNFDFDGSGLTPGGRTASSGDALAYLKFATGIETGTDLSGVDTIGPSWTPITLAGSTYFDNKFRIMTAHGNYTDALRTAVNLTPNTLGYGDTAIIGNVNVDGTNTKLISGFGINGESIYLKPDFEAGGIIQAYGSLTITGTEPGDTSWEGCNLTLYNNNTDTGECVVVYKNTGTNGTGSSFWLTGLNQGTNYDMAYGTGFTTANTKLRLSATGNLEVDGNVTAFSTTLSDASLKDEVATITNPLDKVKALRGVSFVWNQTSRKGKADIGLIAQEVEEVIPEVVHEHNPYFIDDDKTYKTVDYEKIIAVLIEGMKEQQNQIEMLVSEINGLKEKVYK